jgi:hypothetical protein
VTEEDLVREVELTRAFFSEAKGKYTEETDRIISEMEVYCDPLGVDTPKV